MILPNDYDSARSYDGKGFDALPAGGHICKIIGARATQSRNGNDMLEIAFDIAEGSEHDGRFKRRFDYLRKQNPNAKWPNAGMFRVVTAFNGQTNSFFKGFLTAVEESNAGYSFKAAGCNEETLKGKMVGFNFGEEEYRRNDGKVGTGVKAAYAVSVQRVLEGIEPPAKKALRADSAAPAMPQGFTETEEPLPF